MQNINENDINKNNNYIIVVNFILNKREEKMKKKNFKFNTGITLIALVITIIVLLIFASISISMLLGSEGIITQSINSNVETKKATAKEKIQIEVLGSYNNNSKLIANDVKNNILSHIENSQVTGDNFPLDIIVDGYKFTIYENGAVSESSNTKFYLNDRRCRNLL